MAPNLVHIFPSVSCLLAAYVVCVGASTTSAGRKTASGTTAEADITDRPGHQKRSAYSMVNGIVFVDTLFHEKSTKVKKSTVKKTNDLAFLLDLQLLLKPVGFEDFKKSYFESKIHYWDRHADCAECNSKVITVLFRGWRLHMCNRMLLHLHGPCLGCDLK